MTRTLKQTKKLQWNLKLRMILGCLRSQHDVCNWNGWPWARHENKGQWQTVTRNKKGFKNRCFSFRSHNLRQIMGSQQIPSAVQFGSQVIWKMENTSLASVSPGTATKKQASMEGKHRTRKSVNQTSSNGGQRHTQPSQGLAHLEVWQELTGSQQTTLIVVHCENHVSSLKLKVRVSEVWMTSTISYNARSWGRSRTACWGKWSGEARAAHVAAASHADTTFRGRVAMGWKREAGIRGTNWRGVTTHTYAFKDPDD